MQEKIQNAAKTYEHHVIVFLITVMTMKRNDKYSTLNTVNTEQTSHDEVILGNC
jgi:CO dehydrogenase/acetyl-CoA synthase delta subunit